jgi:hypothetical protein
MPAMKLLSKIKVGSKETRKYDEPGSPYHRLAELRSSNSETLTQDVKDKLQGLYCLYNPVLLQAMLINNLARCESWFAVVMVRWLETQVV